MGRHTTEVTLLMLELLRGGARKSAVAREFGKSMCNINKTARYHGLKLPDERRLKHGLVRPDTTRSTSEIVRLRESGLTIGQIAIRHNVTKQRIYQILKSESDKLNNLIVPDPRYDEEYVPIGTEENI